MSTLPVRKGDVFPTTLYTWISARVRSGDQGLREAAGHVMSVYAHPLRVYFLGSGFRSMGEADDLVRGFFADRLSRPEFFRHWLESKRPLRLWLIVGFKHFLYEQRRSAKRGAAGMELPDVSDENQEAPDQSFDRACAKSIVGEALRRAEEDCRGNDLAEHWEIFRRHFLDGQSYAAIAARMAIDEPRAAVMARTATRRFKMALRGLVAWEGASDAQVDEELRSLMEAMES